jgi:hypothetical protein
MKKIIFTGVLMALGFTSNAQTLNDSIVACYSFSGNANDNSGLGLNGVVNGATLTTDRFGNANSAYQFTRRNATYIDIPNFNTHLSSQVISVAFWALADTIFSQSAINLNPDISNNRLMIDPYYMNSGSPSTFFDFGDIFNGGRLAYGSTPSAGTWNHFVFIVDPVAQTMRYYTNGVLTMSKSGVSSLDLSTVRSLRIGGGLAYNSANFYFQGKIDDVIIYDRALTSNEVTDIYTNNFMCSPLSAKEENATTSIRSYPNPANGKVTVTGADLKGSALEIVNTLNQKVAVLTIEENETMIDLSTYPEGVYFFKFTKDGATRIIKTIVTK